VATFKKKRPYIDVNVPRDREQYFNNLLEKVEIQRNLEIDHYSKTPSGLGKWIIDQYLIKHTFFRFKHVNIYEDHVRIYDKKLRSYIDIWKRPPNILACEECKETACIHVQFTFSVPEVRRSLERQGWELPEA